MSKTIAAICVGLMLAAAVGAASGLMKAQPAPLAYSKINSGWGSPISWDEIEISTPGDGF